LKRTKTHMRIPFRSETDELPRLASRGPGFFRPPGLLARSPPLRSQMSGW
jgi:hypothetical protein